MEAAVCVMGGLPLRMAYRPSWYWTMSATAWVSAADPERQHHIVSWTRVSLSVTRFAMYAPVVVLESAPVRDSVSPCLEPSLAFGHAHTQNDAAFESNSHAIRVSVATACASTGGDAHRGTEASGWLAHHASFFEGGASLT